MDCVVCGKGLNKAIAIRERVDHRWENRTYCVEHGFARLRELSPDDYRFSASKEAEALAGAGE